VQQNKDRTVLSANVPPGIIRKLLAESPQSPLPQTPQPGTPDKAPGEKTSQK
jgi:hypothetical protein